DRLAVGRPLLRRQGEGERCKGQADDQFCSHFHSPQVVGKATIRRSSSLSISASEHPSSASNSLPCSPICGGSARLARRLPSNSRGSAGTRIVLPRTFVSTRPPDALR